MIARTVVLLALGATLAVVVQAVDMARRDLLFTRAETELGFWGRGGYHPTPATLLDIERYLDDLLSAAPEHPQYLALRANLAAWQAHWTEDFSAAERFSERAVADQYAALEARPAHRHSWVKMVEYTSRIRGRAPLRTLARDRVESLTARTDPVH